MTVAFKLPTLAPKNLSLVHSALIPPPQLREFPQNNTTHEWGNLPPTAPKSKPHHPHTPTRFPPKTKTLGAFNSLNPSSNLIQPRLFPYGEPQAPRKFSCVCAPASRAKQKPRRRTKFPGPSHPLTPPAAAAGRGNGRAREESRRRGLAGKLDLPGGRAVVVVVAAAAKRVFSTPFCPFVSRECICDDIIIFASSPSGAQAVDVPACALLASRALTLPLCLYRAQTCADFVRRFFCSCLCFFARRELAFISKAPGWIQCAPLSGVAHNFLFAPKQVALLFAARASVFGITCDSCLGIIHGPWEACFDLATRWIQYISSFTQIKLFARVVKLSTRDLSIK